MRIRGTENVKVDFYERKRKTGLESVSLGRGIKRTNDRFIDFQFSMSHNMTNGDLSACKY